MLKKTMALVLTFVMTAALAVPMVAFASSDYTSSDMNSADKTEFSSGQEGKSTIVFKAKTDVPVLNLTITGGGGLVMNPYGIARNSTEFGLTNDTNQILSTKLTVSSQTTVPVKVGATVQAAVTSGSSETKKAVTLAASVADKDTTKKVALCLVAAKDAASAKSAVSTYPTRDASGSESEAGILLVKTAYDADKNTGAVTNASIYTIPAGAAGSAKTCVLQFFGKMVAEPLDNPWVPGDKIEPTVILSFQLQKVATT